MQLELECKLVQLLEKQSGQSTKGDWQKQQFVVSTIGEYPKTIAMTAWKELVNTINGFPIGSNLKISFRIESREYNGKWYTDISPYKIDGEVNRQPQVLAQAPTQESGTYSANAGSNENDSLPF